MTGQTNADFFCRLSASWVDTIERAGDRAYAVGIIAASFFAMSTIQNSQRNVVRRGLALAPEVHLSLVADYHSDLVERIRKQGRTLTCGRLTFRLAEEFGFCYGVNNALNLAYETCRRFPGRRIFLVSEILHSPTINQRLSEMGVRTLNSSQPVADKFASITHDDIVLIPAFGATISEYQALREKGCLVVDTTCGSVVAVWKRVERYAREGFTAVIHGKYSHEETRATSSQALKYENGKYLIVLDLAESKWVCDYIVSGGDPKEFREGFGKACSPQFDPDRDLCRVGLANQTTMLSRESLEIAEMFREAIQLRYGTPTLADRFRHFDTICNATQERQDAVTRLLQEGIDLAIVVGGYKSSNSTHLSEISSSRKPTYHIEGANCVLSATRILHKVVGQEREIATDNWLPASNVVIGITAGASTPSRVVGEVIDRVINCCAQA